MFKTASVYSVTGISSARVKWCMPRLNQTTKSSHTTDSSLKNFEKSCCGAKGRLMFCTELPYGSLSCWQVTARLYFAISEFFRDQGEFSTERCKSERPGTRR